MQRLTTISLMVALSFMFSGCFESGSESTPPPAVEPPPTGFIADGATYYQTNCATCHKAGQDDTTNAFGAADLAQKQDMITNDMSNYDQTTGFNMMLSINNVPDQRVADLKAYLESVAQVVAFRGH